MFVESIIKFQNLSKPSIEYKTSEKYSNYSSTSKLLKISKNFKLSIIATQDVISSPLKTDIIIPKKDLYVHEGTLKYHHEDNNFYYYYFTNLGSYWGDNNFTLIHLRF